MDSQHSELRQDEIELAQGEVVLKAGYSLISMGTEMLVASQKVPPGLNSIMAVPGMAGSFELPIRYGYSMVATPDEGNKWVHLMRPHQDTCAARTEDCTEFPPSIPPRRATLISNLGTALTAVWDGDVIPGSKVLIVGFGLIGSLIARILQSIPETEVTILDVNPSRLAIAADLGFRGIPPADVQHGEYDLAFHCSATSEGLQSAIESVGFEGRVIEVSWYGEKPVNIQLGGSFHYDRKRIIGSQVSNIPGKMQPEWDRNRRNQAVIDLLQDPVYDQHITHDISLREAADLFNEWRLNPAQGLAYCIDYSKD